MFCALLQLATTQSFAMLQSDEVLLHGRVINAYGEPLHNVLVFSNTSPSVKNFTNQEGYFTLTIPQNSLLVVEHPNYQRIEKRISTDDPARKLVLTITLQQARILMQEVVVTANALSVVQTVQQLKRNHRDIPGGTSVAVMNPDVQRLETMKDALKLEPGVIVQEFFGANDQPRISIRGSGIQSNPQRRGLYFLQDGIPVNFADGSFITGVMDPSIAESVEVFKGANALKFGAATLGGAINFNSRTGRHSPGLKIKTESGSFGYHAFTALAGKKWEAHDAHLSVSASKQDGFRQHNHSEKLNVSANFGYKISNTIDNRTYLNYSFTDFDIPGPLSMATLLKDPSQISQGVDLPYAMGPNIARDKPKREVAVMRVANRTALKIAANTEASFGVYYQNIQDRFVFPIVLSTQRSSGNDFGANFQISQNAEKYKLSAGVTTSYGIIDRRGHINVNGLDSYTFSDNRLTAVNATGFAQGYFHLSDKLHLVADLQLAYNLRNSEDLFPNPELRPWYSHSSHQYRYFYSEDTSLKQQYRAFNPRIGMLYDFGKNKDVQFFANLSSSHEPPTFDEMIGTAVTENINTSPKKLYAVKLEKQTAITAEIGSRYEGKRFGWNFSLYQSWIKNELLEVKDFVLGVSETKNYPHTIHRGLELGAMGVPLEGIFSSQAKDNITLKAMYTYSDFYFSSGAYRNNRIAGIPPHYFNGSLEYQYPGVFFVSFAMESQPGESFVDHQNTLKQPSYTIYGFRIGFEKWKRLSFYLEAKNVFNRYYAASYIINDQIHLPAIPFPQFTVNNIAFYMPGPTRAFYLGLTYKI